MMNKYILDDKNKVVLVKDITEWAKWIERARHNTNPTKKPTKVVAQTELGNGLYISTVFLGIDHSWGGGPPLVFETMIFPSKNNPRELEMRRYSTWEEAEQGHKEMIEIAEELIITKEQWPKNKS